MRRARRCTPRHLLSFGSLIRTTGVSLYICGIVSSFRVHGGEPLKEETWAEVDDA